MSIGEHLLDVEIAPIAGSWDERDCRLYALGVGAGAEDPGEELQFTTENTDGLPLRVLPTFGLLQGARAGIVSALAQLPDIDLSSMLHGEQKIEQHRELPVTGLVMTEVLFTGVWDKGAGAVVDTRSVVRDAATGEAYATCEQSLFFRGYGGWGGPRGPQRPRQSTAERGVAPSQFTIRTRPDQPLLYRLSGDDNPLHSDPAFARRAGFPGPIMHGLCVLGTVGRVLLHRYAASDPARFASVAARFSAPTMPGDDLTVSVWEDGRRFSYVVENQDGKMLLSDGIFELK